MGRNPNIRNNGWLRYQRRQEKQAALARQKKIEERTANNIALVGAGAVAGTVVGSLANEYKKHTLQQMRREFERVKDTTSTQKVDLQIRKVEQQFLADATIGAFTGASISGAILLALIEAKIYRLRKQRRLDAEQQQQLVDAERKKRALRSFEKQKRKQEKSAIEAARQAELKAKGSPTTITNFLGRVTRQTIQRLRRRKEPMPIEKIPVLRKLELHTSLSTFDLYPDEAKWLVDWATQNRFKFRHEQVHTNHHLPIPWETASAAARLNKVEIQSNIVRSFKIRPEQRQLSFSVIETQAKTSDTPATLITLHVLAYRPDITITQIPGYALSELSLLRTESELPRDKTRQRILADADYLAHLQAQRGFSQEQIREQIEFEAREETRPKNGNGNHS